MVIYVKLSNKSVAVWIVSRGRRQSYTWRRTFMLKASHWRALSPQKHFRDLCCAAFEWRKFSKTRKTQNGTAVNWRHWPSTELLFLFFCCENNWSNQRCEHRSRNKAKCVRWFDLMDEKRNYSTTCNFCSHGPEWEVAVECRDMNIIALAPCTDDDDDGDHAISLRMQFYSCKTVTDDAQTSPTNGGRRDAIQNGAQASVIVCPLHDILSTMYCSGAYNRWHRIQSLETGDELKEGTRVGQNKKPKCHGNWAFISFAPVVCVALPLCHHRKDDENGNGKNDDEEEEDEVSEYRINLRAMTDINRRLESRYIPYCVVVVVVGVGRFFVFLFDDDEFCRHEVIETTTKMQCIGTPNTWAANNKKSYK